jgi:hypothetical protein
MLPHPDDPPSGHTKCRVVSSVAPNVVGDLGVPVMLVRSRALPMLLAAMPKAAVEEHGDALPSEHDVGLATKLGERASVLSESQAEPVEPAPQLNLGSGVSSAIGLHDRSYVG